MFTKKFYKSKTFWFNLLTLVVMVAAGFGFTEFDPDTEVGAIAIGVVAIINLVLRSMTDTKLEV